MGLRKFVEISDCAGHKPTFRQPFNATPMRNLIRKRLTEYRIDALDNIAVAVNNTKANFAKHGALNSDRLYLFINEHNKTGFAQYIDRSANFIRYVAGDPPPLNWSDLRYVFDI